MFGGTEFLIFTVLLANAVSPEIISASDVQICVDLCTSCGGIWTFEKQVCHCRVPDNDPKASECMKHVRKLQNEKLKLGGLGDQEITNRGTRCCPSKSKKQMRSTDVDRVIKYFVNGGPTRGMAMVGKTQEGCEKNGTTSREPSESRAASLPKKKVKPVKDRTVSEEENVGSNAGDKVEITTTPSSSEEIDEIAVPHAIEPRSFLRYQNRLLTPLPQVLLAIPQALASAAVAPPNGAQYSLLSISQRPNILDTSQDPYLLRTLPYGLRSEQAVQIQVPANNHQHSDSVTQSQLINPYLGVPNALLAEARPPFPYQSLWTPQYDPVFGSIEPPIDDVRRDASKMTEEKVTFPEVPKFLSAARKSGETPTPLHEAIAQQNLLLRALSERLHIYTLALGPFQAEGAPRPLKQCFCSDGGPELEKTKDQAPQGSDRVTRSRSKPARSAEPSKFPSEVKSTQPILEQKLSGVGKPTTSGPGEKSEENSTRKITTHSDKVSGALPPSAMENEEYRWQFLPQYLNQFSLNSYSTYRKKRNTA